MNTLVHICGILAALWLAYLCFGLLSSHTDLEETGTSLAVQLEAGDETILLRSNIGYGRAGLFRVGTERMAYKGKLPDGALMLQAPASSLHEAGESVIKVRPPVVPAANYLGWVFIILVLFLLVSLLLAMRYDYIHPVPQDA